MSLGGAQEAAAVAAATRCGATLLSHDDTTVGQVDTSHKYSVKLAEFPTTMAAADACHTHGIATIMGSANVLRGGSHSASVAALDLAKSDHLDILSSDYVLANLLTAAVQLGNAWNDLPCGIATISANPAKTVGLHDRGALKPELRSNIIRFDIQDGIPVLKGTGHCGDQVA